MNPLRVTDEYVVVLHLRWRQSQGVVPKQVIVLFDDLLTIEPRGASSRRESIFGKAYCIAGRHYRPLGSPPSVRLRRCEGSNSFYTDTGVEEAPLPEADYHALNGQLNSVRRERTSSSDADRGGSPVLPPVRQPEHGVLPRPEEKPVSTYDSRCSRPMPRFQGRLLTRRVHAQASTPALLGALRGSCRHGACTGARRHEPP